METLKLAEKDLQDYDAEVHKLQLRVLDLTLQKTRLENHMVKLRSLQAPIRRLPNELLLRIFVFCCDNDYLDDGDGYYDGRAPMAVFISQTCIRWRELAQSYSRLWSSFSLTLCSSETDVGFEDGEVVAKLKYYLARSKNHPLYIQVHPGIWWEGDSEEEDHPGLQLLVTQSARWRHSSFTGLQFSRDQHQS